MLNFFRHILSNRRKAKLLVTHNERLHKMSADDYIGRALWHCDDVLQYGPNIELADRLSLTVDVRAPDASELMNAINHIHVAIEAAYLGKSERYIKDVPSWTKGMHKPKSLDLWLVDEDGFFIDLNTVINNLREKLVYINKQVNDPVLEEMQYYFKTKPKGVYEDVIKLLKHFN